MVALAFGERYPERVSQLLVIGAADRAHPMSTAWRSVQRRIVRFAVECGKAKEGAAARARAGHVHLSQQRGIRGALRRRAPSQGEEGFVFPVEDYLFARGADYATTLPPRSVSLSFRIHRPASRGCARIFVPTAAVAIREDQLVPLADVRTMVARLPDGPPARDLFRIRS